MTRTLRTLHLKTSQLARALARARAVADAWEQYGPRSAHGCSYREWQAELIELLLIPRVWERMLAGMETHGHFAGRFYQKPVRHTDGNLPGYVMRPWNGPPDDRSRYSHSPGCCWDGIRRELYPSLADDLRAVALGQVPNDRLARFWRIEIVSDLPQTRQPERQKTLPTM